MSNCERNGILKHLWSGIIAVIFGLVLQTAGAVFWAGTMQARINAAEVRIDRLEVRVDCVSSRRP